MPSRHRRNWMLCADIVTLLLLLHAIEQKRDLDLAISSFPGSLLVPLSGSRGGARASNDHVSRDGESLKKGRVTC
ncbi:hypothetical protein R1flu_003685 [Riccia fluitans]|uniref:Secreted protein n=1 Tax=Riccia fluitans TaxID=41844 RepID=A0ABD1YAB6_9MARC